jgi:hypothetical protein
MSIVMHGEYFNDPNVIVVGYALPGEFKTAGLSLNLD